MSFLEEVGIWKIFQFQFFQLFFLRVFFLFFLYITIYILISYRIYKKRFCLEIPFWNIGRTGILEDFVLLILLPFIPLLLESPKSFFVLSLQLILHDGISCNQSLGSNCLADVHTLIAVNLQGELNGTILGLRHTTVRQLLDQ